MLELGLKLLNCQVIKKLDKYTEHIIIHTGQNHNYELNEIFFEQLGIRKPNYFLEATKGNTIKNYGGYNIKDR